MKNEAISREEISVLRPMRQNLLKFYERHTRMRGGEDSPGSTPD